MLSSLRSRLNAASDRGTKLSLTVIELAAAAFAVRVGRKHAKHIPLPELENELEIARKRAKRMAIKQNGMEAYREAKDTWTCALHWIKFNLLPLPTRRSSFGKLNFRRGQSAAMIALAKAVLEERCTEIPSLELISRLVGLAISEIRRGRHPGIKVKNLIACPDQGKYFLFDFIRKRFESDITLHVKIEYMPVALQGCMRTEKYEACKVIEESGLDFPNTTPLAITKNQGFASARRKVPARARTARHARVDLRDDS